MDVPGGQAISQAHRRAARGARWPCLPIHLLVSLIALLLLWDSYGTSAADLAGPYYDLDGPGQWVWLDSSIRLVVDRPLSLREVEAGFTIEPRPADCPRCLTVAREGLAAWDGWAPWADTTVVFNRRRLQIFRPETDYTLSVLGKSFSFHTIPVPRAIGYSPAPGQREVATTAPIEIEFDCPLADNPRYLVSLEPAVPFTPRWQEQKLILEHERLQAGQKYRVYVWPGIRDWAGHPSQERYSLTFTTVEPPAVVAAEPAGDSPQSVFSEVKVLFDRPMDRASVEQSFRLEPAAGGTFHWPDDRTLVWKPWALLYGTSYRISVGGLSQAGDPLREDFSWQLRTQDPPPVAVTTSQEGAIALTFDDQGSKEQVEAILDVLAENQVKAVFFPVGKWAEQNRELIERMAAEGHLLGNHTYSHAHLAKLSEEEIRWEIEHGVGRELLRLPYAEDTAVARQIATDMGYRIYGWNVDPEDWKDRSAQEIVETVMRQVKPGSVIVLHLHGKHTAEALKHLIPLLRQAGYVFGLPTL